jgi:hypothetical protein
MAAGAACSLEATGDPEAMGGESGARDENGGQGGSAPGSGGSGEPNTGGAIAGRSSVGGGRGVVGGAAGGGAYGGKPPIGSAGASVGGSGVAAAGGTNAESGSANGAEPGTGGMEAMGGNAGTSAGGTQPITGGTGGNVGAGGSTGTAGVSGAMNETGGSGGAGGVSGTGGMTPMGACDSELLVNPGFESGKDVGWEETSDWPGIDLVVNENDAALTEEGVSPYAGSFLAWLGGIPDNEWDHNVTLIQQYVAIPATASSLTLSGRHLVKSVDDPDAEYDEAYLEFDLDDAVVWQSLRLTNLSASNDWISFSKTTNDLERVAGKTLLFYAYARTDPTGKTSFFLDSLSLVAGCGR